MPSRPVGQSFGPYRILRELGRGVSGVVHEAVRVGTRRRVALKVLSRPDASRTARGRFRREVEALASLQHPHVVPILDAGEVEGRPYLTMALVEGRTLAELLEEGLDPDEAVELVRECALGIQHAHDRGVLHRDLKPANVIVDEAGHARVADFGLARVATLDDRLTRTGAVLGTPFYMAPEQLAGRRDEIGPASDVFSLGVLLYQALTGELPHAADSIRELIEARDHRPAPPSARPGASSDPLVSALDDVVLEALSPDPGDRPSSAGELARRIEVAVEGEAIHGAPAPRIPLVPIVAVAGPVLLALVGIAVFLASAGPGSSGEESEQTAAPAPSPSSPPASSSPERFRWVEVLPDHPPPRRYPGLARTGDGEALLFGGHVQDQLADTWRLDRDGRWHRLDPPDRPPARTGPAMALDRARGNVVLFGGYARGRRLDDTWIWTGRTWDRVYPDERPPPRNLASMTWDPVREELVLFGGLDSAGHRRDAWAFDGTGWSLRQAGGPDGPAPRCRSLLAADPGSDRLLLFGGIADRPPYTDTWLLGADGWRRGRSSSSPSSFGSVLFPDAAGEKLLLMTGSARGTETWAWDGSAWSHVDTGPGLTPGREYDGLALGPGRALAFAGYDERGRYRADTWLHGDGSWHEIAEPVRPSPRAYAGLARSPREGLLLFGGYARSEGHLADTWRLADDRWTRLDPPVSPPPRRAHVTVEDPARGEVLVFGGDGGQRTLGDTWTWDGRTWTRRDGSAPSPRTGAGTAYVPPHEKVYLFGGLGPDGSYHDDLWAWDGETWSRVETTGPSPPGGARALVWDPRREVLVLFGGLGVGRVARNDLWEWDGTRWTRRSASGGPSPRSDATFVHRDGMNLVIGGVDQDERVLADAWGWDGEDWTRLRVPRSLPARGAHVSAPADERGVITFGGSDMKHFFADTWRLEVDRPAPEAESR